MSRHEADEIIGDRYKIIEFIGEGGMQYVYKAYDSLLDRFVALKTPKNKSAQKRFKRSAIVAAKVNHHNVAKTLDYVRDDENRYLIEELVEGHDLQKAILSKCSFVDPYLAAKIFNYLAKGLAAAHHANVIHRDLKPTNVMVTGGYAVTSLKITDFGIAKLADEELTEAARGGQSTLSTSQTAVGALPYMAPEAIETPEKVGRPADVWSTGAMFYHLLTGDFPFGNGLKAVHNILAGNLATPPRFLLSNSQFRPLAQELLEISKSCLNSDPNSRPTTDELVERCSQICYSISPRIEGKIKNFLHRAWGFISTDEESVFFHKDSVYGPSPIKIGAEVNYSKFDGGGNHRAHPVVIYDKT